MTEKLNKNISTVKTILQDIRTLERYCDENIPSNISEDLFHLEYNLINYINTTPLLVKLGLNEDEIDKYFSNTCEYQLKKEIDTHKFDFDCDYRKELLSKMTYINSVQKCFIDEFDSEHEDTYTLYEYNSNRYVIHENYITGCGRDRWIKQVTLMNMKDNS